MAEGVTEAGAEESVRRRALYRLTVAGMVTVSALLALWWLDRREEPTAEVRPTAPAPIISAPASTAPPEPVAPPPEEAPPEEAPPPPPEVAAVPPAPRPAPAAKPVAAGIARSGSAKAVIEPPVPSPAPEGGGFVLQLGVFGNPANAQELVRQLRRKGIRAHTETRVQLGPFANREEAEKAQAELLRLGYHPVVTTATTR